MMNLFTRYEAVQEEDGHWVMGYTPGLFARLWHALVRSHDRK